MFLWGRKVQKMLLLPPFFCVRNSASILQHQHVYSIYSKSHGDEAMYVYITSGVGMGKLLMGY